MSDAKKPDSVVYNEDTGRYDAFLRPYATERSAPKIVPLEMNSWKRKGAHRVNETLSAEFEEIRRKYEQLKDRLEYNQLVYNARFNFEPVVGKTYHLYRNAEEQAFLSVISPAECQFDYLGSFRLQSDLSWLKTDGPRPGGQASLHG